MKLILLVFITGLFLVKPMEVFAEKFYINCPSKYKGDDGKYSVGPLWRGELDLVEKYIIWDGPEGFNLGKKKPLKISNDSYSFNYDCGELRQRNNCVLSTNVSIDRYSGEFSFWYIFSNSYTIYRGTCKKGKSIQKF